MPEHEIPTLATSQDDAPIASAARTRPADPEMLERSPTGMTVQSLQFEDMVARYRQPLDSASCNAVQQQSLDPCDVELFSMRG